MNRPKDQDVINKLEPLIHSTIALSLTTKQIHWVIQGSNFISIHRYLDEVHADLVEFADTLAEWLVSFDYRGFNGESSQVSLNARTSDVGVVKNMTPTVGANQIASRLDVLIRHYEEAIHFLNQHPVTQDILIGQMQTLVKHRWFLESEIEG